MNLTALAFAVINTVVLLVAYLWGFSRGRRLALSDLDDAATRMAERLTPQIIADTKAEALERLAVVFHERRDSPGGFDAAARVTEHLAARFRAEANAIDDAESEQP